MPDFICKDELKKRIQAGQPCTYEELENLIDDMPILDIRSLCEDIITRFFDKLERKVEDEIMGTEE